MAKYERFLLNPEVVNALLEVAELYLGMIEDLEDQRQPVIAPEKQIYLRSIVEDLRSCFDDPD